MLLITVSLTSLMKITHTYTQPFFGSTDFVRDNPGDPVAEKAFTLSHLSSSSIVPYLLHPLLRTMASSLFNLHAELSFSTISLQVSLVYLLAWHPQLHTPYISSLNHCLLFAAHAHTIAVCFAVFPRLCHLILVSLSTLYFELSCSLTAHIHLTILVSAR